MTTQKDGPILAIDGGGTTTRAGLYTPEGRLLAEAEAEGSNPVETTPGRVVRIVGRLLDAFSAEGHAKPERLVAGIAGMGRAPNSDAIGRALAAVFDLEQVRLSSDAYAMYRANCSADAPVLVIAGTGSCVIARRPTGAPLLVGGAGPIIGDDGSAYGIVLEALHESMFDSELLQALLHDIPPTTFSEVSYWLRTADKREVAALAPTVFNAAKSNPNALAAIVRQIGRLLVQVAWTIEMIGLDESRKDAPYPILCHGGMFEHFSLFNEQFRKILMFPSAEPVLCEVTGHRAALALTAEDLDAGWCRQYTRADASTLASTESGVSVRLDALSADRIVSLMSQQDRLLAERLATATDVVGEVIDTAAACLRAGGRIVYVGAGTSGRLGLLDAVECPPTFGVSPDRVIALMAGGEAALRQSIEGAEDDREAAIQELDAVDPPLGPDDMVIGITASGTTPYPLAAIDRAKQAGCRTALICCNPVPLDRADFVVSLDTGPEILPGSTRLKAGTATKIVLNQISTGAMAKAGHVFEGQMVGVRPVNAKLRSRCIRIIAELTGESTARAEARLRETNGSIALAVLMARAGLSLEEARSHLAAANGILADAMEGL